jgi:predicted CxxxxCH...CXXCH cytochrome family protein
VYAGGHLDTDRPAEVVFGSLASLSSTPVYNASSVSCSNTYCHGSFTNGNATTTPVWNGAAGTGAVCGTCHGDVTKATTREKALPLGTHPTWTSCQWCHTNIDATATITDGSAHVNGTVNLVTFDLPADCARCHGSGTNPAPPNDLDGNTSVTGKGVGAHQAHLAATGAKEIACSECHSVPTAVYESGHLDSDRPAEVAFNGTLAGLTTLGVTPNPTYSSTSASCADTYCHGSFANGNETNAPVWNSAAGSAAECGTCHGDKTKSTTPEKALPKTTAAGGSHPNYTECQWCHTTVTAGPTFVNVDNHVDGEPALFQYTSTADCSRCHGSASNPAPPNDLSGNASSAKVGAHQAHLNPAIAAAVECFECHTVPTTLDYTGSDGHLDGTSGVEITFADSLAGKPTVGGPIPNPTYTSGTMSCGSTYCHGTFKNGNETNAPVWNNPAAAACGTCHGDPVTGNPRPGGNHSTNDNCGICHSVSGGSPVATFNSADSTWTITNKDLHLNGKLSLFTAERNPWP